MSSITTSTPNLYDLCLKENSKDIQVQLKTDEIGKLGSFDPNSHIQINLNLGLIGACISRNPNIISMMINNEARWLAAVEYFNDNLAIIKLIFTAIKQLPKFGYQSVLNATFKYACKQQNKNLITYILEESVTFNRILNIALTTGDLNIINSVLKYNSNPDWKKSHSFACKSGNIDIIKMVENKTIIDNEELDHTFIQSCYKGKLNVVKHLLEGNELDDITISVGRRFANDNNHTDVIQYINEIQSK